MISHWKGVTRDISRRRVLLLVISSLTVLATLPVVGHHLLGSGGNFLDGRDNIGNLCLVALHALLAPVHFGFHVALIAGLVYAFTDRIRAWLKFRRTVRKLSVQAVPATGPLADAVSAGGTRRSEVVVVSGLPNPAFTAGWWRPKVFLDGSLADRLTAAELKSVIAHEMAHVRSRDPLRLAVLRFFACLVFWLPALRRLAEDVAEEAEFEADEVAATQRPLILASAILKVALWKPSVQPMHGVAAFVSSGLVERRVRRLSGESLPIRTHVTTRSLVGAAAMLIAAIASGVVMAHPLVAPEAHSAQSAPRSEHADHKGECSKHNGLAISHLFCNSPHFGQGSAGCPSHAGRSAL